MKRMIVLVLSLILLLAASAQAAQDFAWVNDFNIQAQADPTGFRARLATRFRIGDAEISAVIGNVANPEAQDDATRLMRSFNEAVAGDARVERVMLAVADGLTIARKL